MVMAYKQESPAFQQLQELPEDYVCAVYVEFNLMHENRFFYFLPDVWLRDLRKVDCFHIQDWVRLDWEVKIL